MFLPFQVIKAYFVMLLQNLTLKFSKIKAERIVKETYRAYNSRDELDRVFRVTSYCFLPTRVSHTDREAGVCATVKNRLKFAS